MPPAFCDITRLSFTGWSDPIINRLGIPQSPQQNELITWMRIAKETCLHLARSIFPKTNHHWQFFDYLYLWFRLPTNLLFLVCERYCQWNNKATLWCQTPHPHLWMNQPTQPTQATPTNQHNPPTYRGAPCGIRTTDVGRFGSGAVEPGGPRQWVSKVDGWFF